MSILCSQLQALVNDILVEAPVVELRACPRAPEERVVVALDWDSNITNSDDFAHSGLVRAVKLHRQCPKVFCPAIPRTDLRRPQLQSTMIFIYLRALGSFPSTLFSSDVLERKIAALMAEANLGGV